MVLLVVLAAWTAVPSVVAGPALTWVLLAGLLVLLAASLGLHARSLRWNPPVVLLAVVFLCASVSAVHHDTLDEFTVGLAASALLVGCAVLAANCGPADVRLLTRGVVLLAMVELGVALATVHLGVGAPWGNILGAPGTASNANELIPALGGRSTGSMAHPIPFGLLMAVAVAVCLTPATRWPVVVRLGAVAAAGYGVALSGSRSAAVVLCLALAVAALTPGRVFGIGPVLRTVIALALGASVLLVDWSRLSIVTSLEGTGSLVHRLGALDAVGRLAARSLAETLLGSGTGSLDDLFAEGRLQLDGFDAVDNQLVATFAVAGLIGIAALLAALTTGLWRGAPEVRPAALLLVGMTLSFDLLQWNGPAVLFVAFAVLGSAVPRSVPDDLPSPPAAAVPDRRTRLPILVGAA